MATKSFQELRVYKLSERLADEIWTTVNTWDSYNCQLSTVNCQLPKEEICDREL
ncbi:MAG: hypothetical protein ACMG55_15160 [Microcoleus sp.]